MRHVSDMGDFLESGCLGGMAGLPGCAALTYDLVPDAGDPPAGIWGMIFRLNFRVQLRHGVPYSGGSYFCGSTVPMKDRLR